MLDIVISVALGAIMLVTAYLGVHVTLHPAESPRATKFYKVGFAACALVACVLIGWQSYRSVRAQDVLQSQLSSIEKNTKEPPKVQINNTVTPAPVTINSEPRRAQITVWRYEGVEGYFPPLPGRKVRVNAYMRNDGPVPTTAHIQSAAAYQQYKTGVHTNAEENEIWGLFTGGMANLQKNYKSSIPTLMFPPGNTGMFITIEGQELTEAQLNDFHNDKLLLYFLGIVRYDNGNHKTEFCAIFNRDFLVAHPCVTHNSMN
jgi:hypothetical protein